MKKEKKLKCLFLIYIKREVKTRLLNIILRKKLI